MSCLLSLLDLKDGTEGDFDMADVATKPASDTKRAKQGRSPAYPAISLKTALEKALAQYKAEGKYPAPMASAFTSWGFGAKSSGARDVRAALKYFGLATVEGDGEHGKVKLTEEALRVLLDERDDQTEKKALIRRMALNPPIYKKLLEQFPEGIKSDATAKHFLVFEQHYNEGAVGELIAEFKATADYAELYKPATVVVKPVKEGDEVPSAVKVGDYVQWTSGGVDQFSVPRKVLTLFEDGKHAQVHGSPGGVPMSELTVVEAPKPKLVGVGAPLTSEGGKTSPDINILMAGQRLQITADVDLEGVAKLRDALGKYEELLKMLK
jgi:hypothetical protein